MSTSRASVVGRLIAAGSVTASQPVTFGDLARVNDLAEGTEHGAKERAQLENTCMTCGAGVGKDSNGEERDFASVAAHNKKHKDSHEFRPVLKAIPKPKK